MPSALRRKSAGGVSRVTPLSALRVSGGGSGDQDLAAAAAIIASTARDMASWSAKIPPSVYTTLDGNVATIHAGAPNARPAEFRLEHPLFGNREHWYGPPGHQFLAPAVDARADDALRKYLDSIDRYARKIGWA